jgi:hypothetical protein
MKKEIQLMTLVLLLPILRPCNISLLLPHFLDDVALFLLPLLTRLLIALRYVSLQLATFATFGPD